MINTMAYRLAINFDVTVKQHIYILFSEESFCNCYFCNQSRSQQINKLIENPSKRYIRVQIVNGMAIEFCKSSTFKFVVHKDIYDMRSESDFWYDHQMAMYNTGQVFNELITFSKAVEITEETILSEKAIGYRLAAQGRQNALDLLDDRRYIYKYY
jgi:phosphopantetheine adenylyltransferase